MRPPDICPVHDRPLVLTNIGLACPDCLQELVDKAARRPKKKRRRVRP